MTTSCFVVLVLHNRAPVLLGPMPAEIRTPHMADLRARYGATCGLHSMDVTSDGPDQVSVTVERYEPQGEQA